MTTTFPSLLHSADEQELRGSVRRLLADRSPWQTVLRRVESDEPYDLQTWRTLAAETGVAGLAVPDELGGHGASWRETAVVAEELGRSVALVPFLGSAVLATAALLAAGDTELLPALAAGERTAALAVPLSTWPGAAFPTAVRDRGRRADRDASPASPTRRPRTCSSYRLSVLTARRCGWSRPSTSRRAPRWTRPARSAT